MPGPAVAATTMESGSERMTRTDLTPSSSASSSRRGATGAREGVVAADVAARPRTRSTAAKMSSGSVRVA
ncbi:Uncharacterised protein [Mycobacteroides abscessus subsp. abscessus]|nr:Uncharacterised protein [Mycobacteroides abscessus subsp. abscessus]